MQLKQENNNILFSGHDELTNLTSDQNYTLRIRVLNGYEWSEPSTNLTFKTLPFGLESSSKHKKGKHGIHSQHDKHSINSHFKSKHERLPSSFLNNCSNNFNLKLYFLILISLFTLQ